MKDTAAYEQGWEDGSHEGRLDAYARGRADEREQQAARIAELEAERTRWAKFIADNTTPTWGGDWACVECWPNSDMLRDGFQCVWHEARAALAPGTGEAG